MVGADQWTWTACGRKSWQYESCVAGPKKRKAAKRMDVIASDIRKTLLYCSTIGLFLINIAGEIIGASFPLFLEALGTGGLHNSGVQNCGLI